MPFKPVPWRLRRLARAVRLQILQLPGVSEAWMWGTRNFKIGPKLFICFILTPTHVSLEFKLPPEAAALAARRPFARPMKFAKLGNHGWIEVRLARRSQIPAVLRWIRTSRTLYPASLEPRRAARV